METVHPNDRSLLVRKDAMFSATLLMSATEFYDAERRQFLFFYKIGDMASSSPVNVFSQRMQTVGYLAHLLHLDRNEAKEARDETATAA